MKGKEYLNPYEARERNGRIAIYRRDDAQRQYVEADKDDFVPVVR